MLFCSIACQGAVAKNNYSRDDLAETVSMVFCLGERITRIYEPEGFMSCLELSSVSTLPLTGVKSSFFSAFPLFN